MQRLRISHNPLQSFRDSAFAFLTSITFLQTRFYSQTKPVPYFLGLRPLAGYASLKLFLVMSYFLCETRILCYDRLCMLPTPTPDDAGYASFLGPSWAPTQNADMGSRARAPEAPEKKKQPKKSPETQMQQNTVNSSVLWLGSRARARQKARKPTGKKQGPRSTRASHSKSRTTAHRSAQQFLTVLQRYKDEDCDAAHPTLTSQMNST